MSADPAELSKFDAIGDAWWDPEGPMGPLHVLNPFRLAFVERHISLTETEVLDVGCGGGILSEAMAQAGARVTGIDLAGEALAAARAHAQQAKLTINYRQAGSEDLLREQRRFPVVTCMEMLEHVPDPERTIAELRELCDEDGLVFVATLSRTFKAFALAIVGAEYLLGLLPRGTHEYARFIRPSELVAACRRHGLRLEDLAGLAYDPFRREARLVQDPAVNYIAAFRAV